MKLRFYINEEGKKVYTLKNQVDGRDTMDAHYKFIRLKSIKEKK